MDAQAPPFTQLKRSLRGFSLPMIVTAENKIFAGFVLFFVAAVLYMASNHFPIFPARLLPMSRWDSAIPFIPQTVWIYVSEYLFFVVIYWLCQDVVNLNKYLYSFLSLQTVSVLIFLFWPTTYPRDLFPLSANHVDPLTYWIFSTLRSTDTPGNCAPSLHVSSVFLCAFLFLSEQRKKFPFFLLWGTLIGLSTLTTKQHYILDVVSGLAMAILFHWIFYRRVSYYQAKR